MTEFELIQIADIYSDAGQQNATLLLSILFAYVVIAFLVGKKLERVVAVTLSIVYSMAMISGLAIQASVVNGLNITSQQYSLHFPEGAWVDEGASIWVLATISFLPWISGWLVCLLYMHLHVRRTKTKTLE